MDNETNEYSACSLSLSENLQLKWQEIPQSNYTIVREKSAKFILPSSLKSAVELTRVYQLWW